MHSFISKLIFDWTVWRLSRKQLRAKPRLRELQDRIREAKANHRPVRYLEAERSRLVHADLARSLGRG